MLLLKWKSIANRYPKGMQVGILGQLHVDNTVNGEKIVAY
jgi:hypothetical protein